MRKAPKTPLQEVFLRRVQAEMDRQRISRNQLAQRIGAPAQRTVNDVMNGADPRLETVWGFATALGVSVVSLLTESSNVRQLVRYPPILGQADNHDHSKGRDRKKRRA